MRAPWKEAQTLQQAAAALLFRLNAKPINPNTIKTAPATIIQCGYCIPMLNSDVSFLHLPPRLDQPNEYDSHNTPTRNAAAQIQISSATFFSAGPDLRCRRI